MFNKRYIGKYKMKKYILVILIIMSISGCNRELLNDEISNALYHTNVATEGMGHYSEMQYEYPESDAGGQNTTPSPDITQNILTYIDTGSIQFDTYIRIASYTEWGADEGFISRIVPAVNNRLFDLGLNAGIEMEKMNYQAVTPAICSGNIDLAVAIDMTCLPLYPFLTRHQNFMKSMILYQ